MINLRGVCKQYKGTFALNNIDLDIQQGEFVFLTGSSGAGKSTLMKLLYREEKPSVGNVLVAGIDVVRLPAHKVPLLRRCMGIIFQDYKLLEKQNVYDNVAFVIRTLGLSSRDIDNRVKSALKIVGLSHKMTSKPTELSGGEQQRVGIARALVNGPSILIADEPTGNLDKVNAAEVFSILKRVSREGKCVILVTHDKELAEQCDEVIQLNKLK